MLPHPQYVSFGASQRVIGYAINAINNEGNCFHNFLECLYDRETEHCLLANYLNLYSKIKESIGFFYLTWFHVTQ